MSKRISEHFTMNWMKYVAALVLIPLLWYAVFDILAKPKANERVVISFYGDAFDTSEINANLYENRGSYTDQEIKSIYIEFNSSADPGLSQLLIADIGYSDIIIFTEDMLKKNAEGDETVTPSSLFRFLGEGEDPTLLESIIGDKADNFEYFYFQGMNGEGNRPIGIYLDRRNTDCKKTRFEEYYKGEERCVAFICSESVNIGDMFGDAKGNDTAAIDTLLYLLGEE